MSTAPTLIAACVVAATTHCRADVLFDSITGTSLNGGAFGTVNVEYINPAFTTSSTYVALPFTVSSAGGWTLSRLELYMATSEFAPEPQIPPAGVGRLFFFPRTGALPSLSDDPRTGVVMPYAYTTEPGLPRGVVSINGLDITLAPGDYWIGYAPMFDLAIPVNPPLPGIFPWLVGPAAPLADIDNPVASFSIDRDGNPDWHTPTASNSGAPWSGEFMFRLSGTAAPTPPAAVLLLLSTATLTRTRRR